MSEKGRLIPPRKAAKILCVNQRTLLRRAKAGKIQSVVLPSGFRRYYENEICNLVASDLPSKRNGDLDELEE
ncbi:MAG: MerR family DNA-binding transcriptional regulator [Nitrososphaeria archaeon]